MGQSGCQLGPLRSTTGEHAGQNGDRNRMHLTGNAGHEEDVAQDTEVVSEAKVSQELRETKRSWKKGEGWPTRAQGRGLLWTDVPRGVTRTGTQLEVTVTWTGAV